MRDDAESVPPMGRIGTRPNRPDGIDKVTGHARYGADHQIAGQIVGLVKRAPHAHARILRIDTAKAEALPGVYAVATGEDFPEMSWEPMQSGDIVVNYAAISAAIMARGRVLYEGQPVAAVAARDLAVARAALDLIEVDYEVLPFVVDVVSAMAPDAPVLHDTLFTAGVTPRPEKPSNLAAVFERGHGDVAAAFAESEIIVERRFRTHCANPGYIEPHACIASVTATGEAELWVSTQGPWMVRAHCARILGWEMSKICVTPAEIGGGFGGKTTVILEPLALLLARKSRRPVRMTMTRAETLRATGPAPDAQIVVKIGARTDGTLMAIDAEFCYGAGAFPGSPVIPGAVSAASPYRFKGIRLICKDVVSNRPKTIAYRAPGGPIATGAVEAVIDEIAERLGRDPLELRQQNTVQYGDPTPHGITFGKIGFDQVLAAARTCPHWTAPLGPNQARGVAAAMWYNMGGQTAAHCMLNEDGTVTLVVGTPDIGGLRASLAMISAQELGIDYDRIRPTIGDTGQLGYNFVSAGSRTTFATGKAVVDSTRAVIREVKARAAKIWGIPEDAVTYADGMVRPAGPNAGTQAPLSLADIAINYHKTGGPISGSYSGVPEGGGQTFGVHIADVEVDPETGFVTVARYTVVADAGQAIHPSYVEGQFQGGAAQAIGWALNEELIYGADGTLQNQGFLDYRVPVASDLPLIETHIVEVPNPAHPHGVRGVGEISIVPGVGAILNAVSRASGHRFETLPLSPVRIRAALDASENPGHSVEKRDFR